MIRDLAAKLDKQIELKLVGEATELDKGLIEKDHRSADAPGSQQRRPRDRDTRPGGWQRARRRTGTITLSAAHQGGSILIEVGGRRPRLCSASGS